MMCTIMHNVGYYPRFRKPLSEVAGAAAGRWRAGPWSSADLTAVKSWTGRHGKGPAAVSATGAVEPGRLPVRWIGSRATQTAALADLDQHVQIWRRAVGAESAPVMGPSASLQGM